MSGAKTSGVPTNLPPEGSPPQATEADHEADDGESGGSSCSEASDVSDFFDTLTELYLFFRDADLSRREVNRLLNIFRNPQFSLKELRKWRNYADVKRWGKERAPRDMVPWKTEHIVVHGPRGMSQKLLLHFRDTELLVKKLVRIFSRRKGFVWKPQEKYNEKGKRVFEGPETGTWVHEAQKEIKDDKALILGVIVYSDSTQASRNGRRNAWPVLISLINMPEELRWFEPGHTLAAVLPFCPEWASPTEKARVFQEALKIILGPLMRETARRKKDLKSDTPSVLLRIPGGSSFFLSGAHYAAFEHRAMMQIMPIIIADSSALKRGKAGELRALQVRAFRFYAMFYKAFLGVAAHTRDTLRAARQHAVA
ncbi:unnamed protein product [Closterium sp. Yama58-4]|nr:unnamed protein product [Closterium sp. Yama58-4]